MNYILTLDAGDVIALLDKAVDKREEQKAWDMWLMKFQHMTQKSFIPFSSYYKSLSAPNVSRRPTEEILQEAQKIREKARSSEGSQGPER